MSDIKIASEIKTTRDLDGETSKPRLTRPLDDPNTPQSKEPQNEKKLVKPRTPIKPEIPKATFQLILTPYLRTPLEGAIRPTVSTYVPSAHMMYYIIHLMDEIIRRNTYFRRQQDDWFPFISRLYFGILFIIQTLRAQNATTRITPKQKTFLQQFLKDYPPEVLPIPGPLVTLFESLNACRPSNTLEAMITPAIPEELGPATATNLIIDDDHHRHQLLLPNIPMIIGFINTITAANPAAIPNYANTATFDDNVDRNLNGHLFNAQEWTQLERNALMTPGTLYTAETDATLNASFNTYGPRLNLPQIIATSPTRTIHDFMCMRDSNSWFGNILPIMESYCSYFLGSSNLQECTKSISVSPLITTHYVKLSSSLAINNYSTLRHAFPSAAPFSLDAKHTSTENSLPPAAAMLAQSAQLNVRFSAGNIPDWIDLGSSGRTRFGDYWNKIPFLRISSHESCFKGYSSIISKAFALARPPPK